MAAKPEQRRVSVGHVELALLEAGVGGRGLLFVHGFTGAKEDFADALVPLADRGWHAVAPDLRGHGQSDHPVGESSYSLGRFAEDLSELFGVLGWSSMMMLGHSMGGMVAQVFALSHPEILDGLVLMDTTHGPPTGFDLDMLALAKGVVQTEGLAKLLELQHQLGDPLSTPAHLRLLEDRPGYAEFEDAKCLASSRDMWLSVVDEMFLGQTERLGELAGLRVPTLVIVGEQDKPFLEPSRAIADVIPGAKLEVIAGAGHSAQFENWPAWWNALTGFVDSLARSRQTEVS